MVAGLLQWPQGTFASKVSEHAYWVDLEKIISAATQQPHELIASVQVMINLWDCGAGANGQRGCWFCDSRTGSGWRLGNSEASTTSCDHVCLFVTFQTSSCGFISDSWFLDNNYLLHQIFFLLGLHTLQHFQPGLQTTIIFFIRFSCFGFTHHNISNQWPNLQFLNTKSLLGLIMRSINPGGSNVE